MFQLEIFSPEGLIYSDLADKATLPTTEGEISILSHHVPLFSKLSDGEIQIESKGKKANIAITGGFLEVTGEIVTILSDYAIKAENIQVARAQAAKTRAEEIMKDKKGQRDFILAEKELRKSILELKVAGKLKKRHIIQ